MLIGGFAHPESVIHDTVDDVYLVSNVAGEPVEHDNNGFISRVAPSGEVLELEWVKAGQLPSLDAPKGLAIVGDVLVVTDIDSLIFINRKTGAGLYDMSLGGEFFNDVAVDQDGRVVFTDTGFPDGKHEVGGRQSVFISESRGGFQSMGGSMAWSLDWKRGPNHPNGIAVRDGALLVVTMGSGSLWELGLEPDDEGGFSAKPRQLGDPKTIPNSLDGLVVLEDGRLLVSSWDTNTVYEVSVDSTEWTPIIEDVPSPADIGYDRTRKRVLIPCFTTNELRIHQLPGHSVPGAPARLGHGKP